MALFHLEAKILGKTGKNGGQKNIEAIVAYRHCAKIDEFDYTKKSKQLVDSFMIFPNNFNEVLTNSAQIWANSELNQKGPKHNLEQAMAEFQKFTYVDFWKSAGKAEKRKDAQYCEELIISLQHELTLEENKANLKKLLEDNYTSKGKAADVCIHNSGNNLHAHVLITQRPIEGLTFDFQNPNGIGFIFGKKIRDQKFGGAGFKVDEITPIREQWANLCNASFRKRDLTHEISHLSLVEQKEVHILRGDYQTALELDREPSRTIHRSTPNFEQKIKARKIAKKNAIEENFKNIEKKSMSTLNSDLANFLQSSELLQIEQKGLLKQVEDLLLSKDYQNLLNQISIAMKLNQHQAEQMIQHLAKMELAHQVMLNSIKQVQNLIPSKPIRAYLPQEQHQNHVQ